MGERERGTPAKIRCYQERAQKLVLTSFVAAIKPPAGATSSFESHFRVDITNQSVTSGSNGFSAKALVTRGEHWLFTAFGCCIPLMRCNFFLLLVFVRNG